MKIVIRKSRDGKAYITLKARNGRVVLVSETYDSAANARRAARSLVKTAAEWLVWTVDDQTRTS